MIFERERISDDEYIEWAWTTLQVYPEDENICLSCGARNVAEDHECEEDEVA